MGRVSNEGGDARATSARRGRHLPRSQPWKDIPGRAISRSKSMGRRAVDMGGIRAASRLRHWRRKKKVEVARKKTKTKQGHKTTLIFCFIVYLQFNSDQGT